MVFYGILWYFMVLFISTGEIILYAGCTPFIGVSLGKLYYMGVNIYVALYWCFFRGYYILWCFMVFYGILWYYLSPHSERVYISSGNFMH